MTKYKLGKPQIKRLIEGKSVMDGHGRHFYANDDVKDYLHKIHDNNLYDRFDVILEDGGLDIVKKQDEASNQFRDQELKGGRWH